MVKRYCDKCGQQIDDGVHSWYIVELHGTDGELRHKEMCEECYATACEDGCVPKVAEQIEPTTQTETQNSNLTFEKDECAKEYDELGLKELKELINADRKTENNSEIPNNCDTCKIGKTECGQKQS